MRVLYHHRTQGRGVEGVHIMGIVQALRKRGCEVDILSPSGLEREREGAPARARVAGKRLRALSRRAPELVFELMEIAYNLRTAPVLSRVLEAARYDLVYERYSLLTWVGLAQAVRHRIPCYLEVNYTSWTPIFRRRSRLLLPVAHRIDRRMFREATGLFVVSSYLRDHLVALGCDPAKLVVLPNAADPARFAPGLAGSAVRQRFGLAGRVVIGFVGYFYPWHSVDLLVEAAPAVLARVPAAVFLLVGDGPTRAALERRVRELGLEKQVLFTGAVDHEHLCGHIAAFDVAVIPHSNDYGSPMKLYEYLAMGKPVVAPDLSPVRDGLTEGEDGRLFEPKNGVALGAALVEVLQAPDVRAKMGAAARRKVETIHNWDARAGAVLDFHHRSAR